MKKNRKILIVVLPVVFTAMVLGYLYIQSRSPNDPNSIRVSGNIEVTDAEVSFKISGLVKRRFVDEGELVQKGDVIARLDSSDLAIEVEKKHAELLMAQANLAELEAGSRPQEIAEAEAKRAAAKAEKEHLESDFRRAGALFAKKVLSIEEYVHSRGVYEVAVARLKEADEQLKLIKKGPRREKIEQARAKVKHARAAFQLSKTYLGYATLVSPLSGIVLSKNIEPGEYVAPGTPVVTVGDLKRPWHRAYIDETDLGRVKVGQQVNVFNDTYPDKVYKGHISFISSEAEFTPKTVQTEKQRVKLVYRIKVVIPNPNMELKPGMPADAVILIDNVQEESHGYTQN